MTGFRRPRGWAYRVGVRWGLSVMIWPRLGLSLVGRGHEVWPGPRFGLGGRFHRRKFGEMRVLAAAAAVSGLQRQRYRRALSVFLGTSWARWGLSIVCFIGDGGLELGGWWVGFAAVGSRVRAAALGLRLPRNWATEWVKIGREYKLGESF